MVYVDGAMIQRIGQNQRRGMEPDVDDFPLDEEHTRMDHDDYDDDIRLVEEQVVEEDAAGGRRPYYTKRKTIKN